ncbi:MAG: 3-isopropylmalate dehydrogenase [Alphaproteobacteria bacterium]|nr:3-isopropylmalate dehydrogenase [Alphaproteobacteria bacterium]
MAVKKILMTSGDGIGPEVMGEVKKIISFLNNEGISNIQITERPIGGASIDEHGVPVTDETIELGRQADCVLLGAVGGPKWDQVDYNIRPEAGLLKIRKELGLFANLRPALVFDALIDASTLKPEIIRGLDILIVRELTGGVYFGEPRGITTLPNGERQGVNTQVYTTSEIQRVARVAFELAQKRSKKLCSCEKANVMESGKLWREDVTKLAPEYPDVQLSHMYADNCAMQLLKNPRQFDVIVTDNLFGDILSDEASMLTGSLGMLPSASLGARDDLGHQNALYEPVHGSAPDIAGQNKANPMAAILSFAMALRFSLDQSDIADHIEAASRAVLDNGIRTGDIMADGCTLAGTSEIGDAVITELKSKLKRAA